MHDEGLNILAAIDNAYKTGVNEERDRIVKLLESLEHSTTHSIWDYNDKVASVIALIKNSGHTKDAS